MPKKEKVNINNLKNIQSIKTQRVQ